MAELITKLRLFCATDRGNEEIEALFSRVSILVASGMHINAAVEGSLNAAHRGAEDTSRIVMRRESGASELLLDRHKAVILELRQKGYGYGTIAKMLAKKKIYNKRTKKAYSRHTIKNALIAIDKEKNEYA